MSGWISVEDRLPEENASSLIYIPEWLDGLNVIEAWFSGKHEDGLDPYFYVYGTGGEVSFNEVTHWQPLPEPPGD